MSPACSLTYLPHARSYQCRTLPYKRSITTNDLLYSKISRAFLSLLLVKLSETTGLAPSAQVNIP